MNFIYAIATVSHIVALFTAVPFMWRRMKRDRWILVVPIFWAVCSILLTMLQGLGRVCK